MTGTIRVDGALADQLDAQIRDFVQANVFRGTVKVVNVTRSANTNSNTQKITVSYDVSFTGVLDLLAGERSETN